MEEKFLFCDERYKITELWKLKSIGFLHKLYFSFTANEFFREISRTDNYSFLCDNKLHTLGNLTKINFKYILIEILRTKKVCPISKLSEYILFAKENDGEVYNNRLSEAIFLKVKEIDLGVLFDLENNNLKFNKTKIGPFLDPVKKKLKFFLINKLSVNLKKKEKARRKAKLNQINSIEISLIKKTKNKKETVQDYFDLKVKEFLGLFIHSKLI